MEDLKVWCNKFYTYVTQCQSQLIIRPILYDLSRAVKRSLSDKRDAHYPFLASKMKMEEEKGQDVRFEQAMEIAGYGKFSVFITVLSGLSILCSFLSSLDVSFVLPAAECDLHLSSQDKGLLGSAYFFGILVSCHLSGLLADTLGRRYILLRAVTLNIFTYLFGAFAPNFWTFFILKLISGIVTCPCMIAPFPFVGEYVPAKNRTRTLQIATALSTLGFLYASVIGWTVLPQQWEVDIWVVIFKPWRLFCLLCGLPSVICALLFYFTPESPKFLLTRGKKGDSVKVLQRVYSINLGQVPQKFPVMSVSMDEGETVPPIREKGAAGVLKHVYDQTMPLFKPPYVKNLLLCIIILYTALFCINSILLWLPEVSNRIASYENAHEGKFYMCQMLMKESVRNVTEVTVKTNTSAPLACEVVINTAVFPPNIIIGALSPFVMMSGSLMLPYLDKRYVISLVMVLCSAGAFFINWVPDSSIIIVLFGAVPLIMSIAFSLLTSILVEVFPTYIRAMAVSITMICGRLGSISGSSVFSYLIDYHCPLLFQLYSGLFLCCATVPFFLKLQTTKPQQPAE